MRRIIENVQKYSEMISIEFIENDPHFLSFAESLSLMQEPPFILFFDMSNLNVTLNHFCNLKFMYGTLKRATAVAFEKEAELVFQRHYPHVPIITIDFTAVKAAIPEDLENRKYIIYQLILLIRARVSTLLAARNIDFWCMQQDSIWTENFLSMDVEARFPQANLIFDTVGNDQIPIYQHMKGWICGSTFFVRGNKITAEFFKKVDLLMRSRQSPDSAIMTYLCGAARFKCAKMPRWMVSSSNFFMGNRDITPIIIQVDHESNLTKMELFKREKFVFRMDNGTCNYTALAFIRQAVNIALPELISTETEDKTSYLFRFLEFLNEIIGFDPYHNKYFLHVHEGIV
ncbi:hypothetical protein WR25_00186 [Diploscapter pachys]|uniref:Nucleotide-diphospho-sugar transferase domain-containing protein n=1 Tax=Diploscapter pachys TaxID=2018661 RepID=A0A2A2J4F6_9BILA|nr:hypothetical protein WR25_00186 [Diploscapter pachys]